MSWPKNPKTSTVQGEDPEDFQSFRQGYQRSIGKVHRQVSVLLHQYAHPSEIAFQDFLHPDRVTQHEIPEQGPAHWPIKKVKNLRQYRPTRHEAASKLLERRTAVVVRPLRRVEKSDQRSRITKCLHDAWQGVSLLTSG